MHQEANLKWTQPIQFDSTRNKVDHTAACDRSVKECFLMETPLSQDVNFVLNDRFCAHDQNL